MAMQSQKDQHQAPRHRGDADRRKATPQSDEAQPYRPPGRQQGLGWARRRDINDTSSQQAAPSRGGRYDRTGEEGYAEGLEDFEEAGGADEGQDDLEAADGEREVSGGASEWELDEGGVQFGRPRPRSNATPDDGVATPKPPPRKQQR